MTDLYQNSAIQLLSEPQLTTERNLEFPGQIPLGNYVFKSNREVKGYMWPMNEKSKLPMHYNQMSDTAEMP